MNEMFILFGRNQLATSKNVFCCHKNLTDTLKISIFSFFVYVLAA